VRYAQSAVIQAPEYLLEAVPGRKTPELRTVREAAEAVGVHEMTVWRWLRAGLLTRYKSVPSAPRRTMVDLAEVHSLKEHPPAEPEG